MDEHIEKILLKVDEIEGDLEFPSQFDVHHLESEVKGFGKSLEKSFEEIHITYNEMQDASYTWRMTIYTLSSETERIPTLGIIFSNFGKLVSAYAFEHSNPTFFNRIIAMLREHGFIHIPPQEVLSAEYTGRHNVFKGFTWHHRFFSEI